MENEAQQWISGFEAAAACEFLYCLWLESDFI